MDMQSPPDLIATLESLVRQRRSGSPDESYVARLAHKGRAKMAQKLGEEAVEAVIAAVQDDRSAMVGESADLIFHLLMLLADMDLSWSDVIDELSRRQGLSGLAEKAARTPD